MKKNDDFPGKITISELVTPEMANFAGNLFGGVLLSLTDKAAYVCARRYSKKYCVTASLDQVSFLEPVYVGELITFHAHVVYVGKTSMSIEIIVTAENLSKRSIRKVSTCFAAMVAMKNGKPQKVPPLKCTTEEQKRNFQRAKLHRELAKEYAKKLKELEND